MWYKLENNEDSGRVARASAPMLGDQLEVALSQVSIDVPSAILLSLKKKRKLVLSGNSALTAQGRKINIFVTFLG